MVVALVYREGNNELPSITEALSPMNQTKDTHDHAELKSSRPIDREPAEQSAPEDGDGDSSCFPMVPPPLTRSKSSIERASRAVRTVAVPQLQRSLSKPSARAAASE